MRFRQIMPTRIRVAAERLIQDTRNVRAALGDARVRTARIDGVARVRAPQEEVSAPAVARAPETTNTHAEVVATLVFTASGVTLDVRDPETSILEAGLGAGVDLIYSCTLGGCAACILDVEEGQIDYEDRDAVCLTEDELESGEVCLACVGRPRGRVVVNA